MDTTRSLRGLRIGEGATTEREPAARATIGSRAADTETANQGRIARSSRTHGNTRTKEKATTSHGPVPQSGSIQDADKSSRASQSAITESACLPVANAPPWPRVSYSKT